MSATTYAYSAEPLRNPFRYALALWRTLRDPSRTDEVAIVQLGLLRTRFARRFVRPGAIAEALARDPRTAPRLDSLRPAVRIDLEALARLPLSTFGRAVASHLGPRGLDPNLVDFPTRSREELVLNHLYATHDLWHVVTGFGNDLPGEAGIGGFYAAQLDAPPFIALQVSMLFCNSVFFQPATLHERMAAFAAGYEAGRRAKPLFGIEWENLWSTPLQDVREQLGLCDVRIVGEGIPAAA
jgi:ubiquinone biosynthesis protein Coq4